MSISFGLEIILDCDTIEKAHKAARRYIKQLESQGSAHRPNPIAHSSPQQAPSTLRALEQHAQIQTTAPLAPPVPTARMVGGEVSTGAGTRGPRKF